MEQFKDIIDVEEKRINHIVGAMRATLADDAEDRERKDREIAELKRQKLDAVGWREKREIDETIDRCRERYAMRRYQDSGVLSQPYFGILELEDDDLGSLSTCLGRQSFFDKSGKALVIDWREAPVSRLYYEYDAGELYEEDIRGRERSGVVRSKRQVDTSGGELRKIVDKAVLLVRRQDGSWHRSGDVGAGGGSGEGRGGAGTGGGMSTILSGKEEKSDHRLPEITALISRDQFQAITHPESSTVLLQGGAGSGKTTVGLHRIAYLAYQDSERFQPGRILVVMFNRSLQHYISRVLPELGIGPGVLVETYHGWAGKLFRAAGVQVSYSREAAPPEVIRLKKHRAMLDLVDRYLERLLSKSRKWLLDRLAETGDTELDAIRALLQASVQMGDFLDVIKTHRFFAEPGQPETRKRLRSRLLKRLNDHMLDLHTLLMDRDLWEAALGNDSPTGKNGPDQLVRWQTKLRSRNAVDFADTGILLWIMQRKGIGAARPGYGHVMVDEAQDLSEMELATLLHAADDLQSITICGDMAQKIKGDVSFDSPDGFAGFIRGQQKRTGARKLCSDTLVVGYRATRPIMELAWHVLGEKPSMAVARDGEPVRVLRTASHDETMAEAKAILGKYLEERPKAIVAVVCRYKADANRVFEDLKVLGLPDLRRHERDDFSFKPGVIVTNGHQVKGLEFSAVLVVNPSAAQFRDDPQDRMLLHVVMTRAADHLWIIGHQPMAFGLENRQA
jgi:DNA helicase-2/ATP-dependent DNA helicase PcrA